MWVAAHRAQVLFNECRQAVADFEGRWQIEVT